jgi:hypothetical protein
MQRALHPGMRGQLSDYYTTSRKEDAGLWPYEGKQAGRKISYRQVAGGKQQASTTRYVRKQPLGNQQGGSMVGERQANRSKAAAAKQAGRQPDRLQVDENWQVAKQALGCQEEITMQAERSSRKAPCRKQAVAEQAGRQTSCR